MIERRVDDMLLTRKEREMDGLLGDFMDGPPHIVDNSTVKRPVYEYHSRVTGCFRRENIRESNLWCEVCAEVNGEWTMLHRVITKPSFFEVIHREMNPATGKMIGDRRQFAAALRESADRQSEVVGYTPNMVEASAGELMHGDVGLREQHDRHVELGWKEATGKTVWDMKGD